MDVEWAKDGDDGTLYIVQARPETVHSHENNHTLLTIMFLSKNPKVIVKVKVLVKKLLSGTVKMIHSSSNILSLFKRGDILVTEQ